VDIDLHLRASVPTDVDNQGKPVSYGDRSASSPSGSSFSPRTSSPGSCGSLPGGMSVGPTSPTMFGSRVPTGIPRSSSTTRSIGLSSIWLSSGMPGLYPARRSGTLGCVTVSRELLHQPGAACVTVSYGNRVQRRRRAVPSDSLGDVAQLARAPALQAGGRGFESHRLHHVVAGHGAARASWRRPWRNPWRSRATSVPQRGRLLDDVNRSHLHATMRRAAVL
jgi:hypothetical protein